MITSLLSPVVECKLIFIKTWFFLTWYKIFTRSDKKHGRFCLEAHRGLKNWPTDKSWVSFEKFRKFPVQWAQKLCIFTQNCLRYEGSKLATLTLKYWSQAAFLKIFVFYKIMSLLITWAFFQCNAFPRKNGLLRIKFHPIKHSEMPFGTIRGWW